MSNARLGGRAFYRRRLIALSVAACFTFSSTYSAANPTGGTVASGSAIIAGSGNTLTITNSANAIINWQSFSIGVNEITRFIQSSGSSAVLNRVVGVPGSAIPQSKIDGLLQSVLANGSTGGRVFLINPSGVVIGPTGRIDVAGFVASSLNLSDADFNSGRMRFTETPGAGAVINRGVIETTSGGRVYLVAPDVQNVPDGPNTGIIRAPQGEIILAAGKSVELVSETSPFVTVTVTADSERALNLGQLIADSGRVGMYGALVRQGGTAQANAAVAGANGEIRLVATQNVTLDAGSVASASGGAQGGNVQVSAPVVVQAGDIRADGDAGGSIRIDAGNFLQAGTLSASGSIGAGGAIAVTAPHVIQTASAVMAADGADGKGGSIAVDASGAADGLLFSSAKYSATGDKGGDIKLLGHDIVLLGASADASGPNGGGSILVGGDAHGANPAVANASTTGVNFSTTLKADATQNGDGGKIVVWSDNNTQFFGSASARGGAQSGNGGAIEISGLNGFTMGGLADAGARYGVAGTVLLDPKNIIIDANAGSGTLGSFQLLDPNPVAGNGFGTNIVVLPNQNVAVTAPNDNFGASGAGAVFLYNSNSGALISALTGSSANDHVGSSGITPLASGNFVVGSPGWNNGTTATAAGALTFGSGTTGVNGAVSAANSLVGSTTNDQIGGSGSVVPLGNGYVVVSPAWSNGVNAPQAGAVTVGSGTNGIVGPVSSTNSLVGSGPNDNIGSNGIALLNNGAFVVISSNWSSATGAVTFVNASTNVAGVVSAGNSLVGRTTGDQVGSGFVTPLNNGNYLVFSPSWNGTAGAVTLMNGANGTTVTGGALGVAVSATNSLVGSAPGDGVGSSRSEPLSNGNYVVLSPDWANPLGVLRVGAVTFGTPTSLAVGPVSQTNSLVGSTVDDHVGQFGIRELTNGNFLVLSPNWNINSTATLAGAVTFASGTTGVTGVVSSANSLVGGTAGDQVGAGNGTVVALTNGNYVVTSPGWDQVGAAPVVDAGAATWGSGIIGVSGTISAANSLIGSKAGDRVGLGGITALSNGNYVVASQFWANGTNTQAGAVTVGNGVTGTFGPVSPANSLVGSATGDQVGQVIREVGIPGSGNFVVGSPNWSNGATAQVGAATFVDGTTGLIGPVSSANSLVGSTAGDQVGNFVAPLGNGNYVVLSPNWSNGAATQVGAVTFGSGTTGIAGPVSATNSLVGSTTNDHVGSSFGTPSVTPLVNGNYLVSSPEWNNGAATQAGAVTLVNGTNGNIVATGAPGGAVSATNSLVGTHTNDFIGSGRGATPLLNSMTGEYVVISSQWNGGMGAVTFGTGAAGVVGPISSANSLVGSTADNPVGQGNGDRVGSGGIIPLNAGNFLVVSPQWNNSAAGATRAGAVTWVNGTNGHVFGQATPGAVVSAANSLVGGTSNDQVGGTCEGCNSGAVPLPNGNFAVITPTWTNPVTLQPNAGAVSFGTGNLGVAGLISPTNSIVGSAQNDGLGSGGIFPLTNGNFVVSSPNATNSAKAGAGLVQVVTPGVGAAVPATGQTFSANPSSDVTITPASITAITNTGTALVLQANNDITLNAGSDITTSASGLGGSVTLQAGRSVILNSSLSTDNGAVTVVANERAINGVIDANRDPGAAVIAMAPGTIIKTGTSDITLILNDGAGLSNSTSGNITLGSLTTNGNVLVQNLGPTAGSGIVRSDPAQLVTAGSAAFDVNGAGGGGAIGTAAAPLRVRLAANLAARAQAGGAFFDSPLQGLTIGAAGALTGITAVGAGGIGVSAAGPISVTQAVSSGSGAVTLASTGAINETGAGVITTAGTLTTSSSGGAILNGANAVGTFNATNTVTGDLVLANTGALIVTGVNQTGGNVLLNTTGAMSLTGAVSAGAGNISLAAGGALSESGGGLISAAGALTTSSSGSAILNGANAVAALNATNTGGGDVVFTNTGALTVLGISETGGNVILSTSGAMSLTGALSAGTGSVTLAAGGALSESGAGAISTTGTLTTSSVGGTSLTGANAVSVFKATNTAGSDVALTNTAALAVTGISNPGGDVRLNNSGAITIAGAVSAGSATVTLASGGAITGSGSGSVQGSVVTLSAPSGAIGSPVGTPLEVITPSLSAVAANGIAIDLNGASPQAATVNALQNTANGDIVLNAHGGATFTTLVTNPGGSVTINSFSPLDVGAGITAGNSIFLSTSGGTGVANDMSLAGTYTYNVLTGAFEVTIGSGGQLTLFSSPNPPLVLTAPLFPNPVNITKFTFVASDVLSNPDVALAYNTTVEYPVLKPKFKLEDEKKDEQNKQKKQAAACK